MGTTQGGQDLYINSQGLNTSVTVTNLPTGGSTIWVRLYTRNGTGWHFNDYSYTAATNTKAALTLPTPGTHIYR